MIDPTTGEEQINPLESMIESTILQNESMKEQGQETNALLEAIVLQGNSVEPLLEAQIIQSQKNNKELKEALKESTFNFQIDGVEMASITGPQGEKGEKGDKGDDGAVSLEMPDGTIERKEGKIVVKGLKGDKGDKGEQGEKGESGKDGVDGKVIFGANGRNGLDGIDGKDGVDGANGRDGSPDTPKQIKKKLESLKDDERLDVKAIKGIKDFQKQLDRVAGFASQGQEYRISGTKVANNSGVLNFVAGSGATITGVPTSDGATITIGASGGGGAVDSVNGQTGVVVLDTGDIAEATNLNYVSDAQLTVIGNTSGTNTGDVTVSDSSEIDFTLTGQQISASIVSGSIDETKLDTSVNASLDLADTAVQPAGLSGYELLSNKATDFSTVNNTLYPTVQAVNTAINTAVTGLLDYRGSYDASTNLFPATGGSGLIGAILSGDFWVCSVAGTLGGVPVTAGDLIIAIVDTPGQTASNWDLIENTLGYTPENAANKVTSISGASTDTQYPSAKLTYDQLATKQATLVSATNIKTVNSTSLLGSGNIDTTQTSVSGNAGTATALATPRTIGTLTGDVTSTGSSFDGTGNNTNSTTVTKINGTSLAGLATGILKNTTSTGVPSIAVNSDLPVMTATVGGAVPTPPNNTTTFLRGDGTFAAPSGGFTSQVKAYLGSNQTISTGFGSRATLVLDTESYDTGSEFNTGTYTFTAGATGYYQVCATLNWGSWVANTGFEFYMVIATVEKLMYNLDMNNGTGAWAFNYSQVIKLSATQTLSFKAAQYTGSNKTLTGGDYSSWVTITRVG